MSVETMIWCFEQTRGSCYHSWNLVNCCTTNGRPI